MAVPDEEFLEDRILLLQVHAGLRVQGGILLAVGASFVFGPVVDPLDANVVVGRVGMSGFPEQLRFALAHPTPHSAPGVFRSTRTLSPGLSPSFSWHVYLPAALLPQSNSSFRRDGYPPEL